MFKPEAKRVPAAPPGSSREVLKILTELLNGGLYAPNWLYDPQRSRKFRIRRESRSCHSRKDPKRNPGEGQGHPCG